MHRAIELRGTLGTGAWVYGAHSGTRQYGKLLGASLIGGAHSVFHEAQVLRRGLVSLRRGQREPGIGSHIVLRHAHALRVEVAQIGLGGLVTLLRSKLRPTGGFGVILRHAI